MKLILESAFNHHGKTAVFKELIQCANRIQPDFFTFQLMTVDEFCVKDYKKYDLYQEHTIPPAEMLQLVTELLDKEITPLACTLDNKSFELTLNAGIRHIKLHATDISNLDLIERITKVDDIKVFLETQAATSFEIKKALDYLGDKVVCLFHGFSDYPTELADVRFNTFDFFEKEYGNYGLNYGYADHSRDIDLAVTACAAKGVGYLELHLTNDRRLRHFDWEVSYEESELKYAKLRMERLQKFFGTEGRALSAVERRHRPILHKKYLNGTWLRSDSGRDYWTTIFSEPKIDFSIAVIARLKSKRLTKKALKHWHHDFSITGYLMERFSKICPTTLATSYLDEDDELAEAMGNWDVLRGTPLSVADRLLDVGLRHRSKYVIRLTGDNPLTDTQVFDDCLQVALENDYDYVRAVGLPLGLSAEIIKTETLWSAIAGGLESAQTEYLSWQILIDSAFNKAVIKYTDVPEAFCELRATIDYEEDYTILKEAFGTSLNEGSSVLQLLLEGRVKLESEKASLKLPGGETLSLREYEDLWESNSTVIEKRYLG